MLGKAAGGDVAHKDPWLSEASAAMAPTRAAQLPLRAHLHGVGVLRLLRYGLHADCQQKLPRSCRKLLHLGGGSEGDAVSGDREAASNRAA